MSKRKKKQLITVGPTSSIEMTDETTIAKSKIVSDLYVGIVKDAIGKCERRKGAHCYVVGHVYATINNYGCEGVDFVRQSFIVKRFSEQKLQKCSSLFTTVYYPLGAYRQKLEIHFELKVFDENNNVPCDEIAFYLHDRIQEATLRDLNLMIESDDEALADVATECRRSTLSTTEDLLSFFKQD